MLWKKYYTRRIKLLQSFMGIFQKLSPSPDSVTPQEYIELSNLYEQLKQYTKSQPINDFIKNFDTLNVKYARNGFYYSNTIGMLIKEAAQKNALGSTTFSPPDLRYIFILYQNSELYTRIIKELLYLIKYFEEKSKLGLIEQYYFEKKPSDKED